MATKKAASGSKKPSGPKDAAAFVDFIHKNPNSRKLIKKGWDAVVKDGKKKGFKFTKQQLHDHLKEKYNITKLPTGDEPDTCICV